MGNIEVTGRPTVRVMAVDQGAHTRPPRPGELCACGQPAKTVLIKQLGEVPSCRGPADYAYTAMEQQVVRQAVLRALGQ